MLKETKSGRSESQDHAVIGEKGSSIGSLYKELPKVRDLYLNTTHTFLKCNECFEAWKALEICQKKLVRLDGCNRAYCGIWKDREDMPPRSPLIVGAWRAQVHWVD